MTCANSNTIYTRLWRGLGSFTSARARELVPDLTLSHLGNVIPFTLRPQPEDRLPEPVGSSMNRRFNMAASSARALFARHSTRRSRDNVSSDAGGASSPT